MLFFTLLILGVIACVILIPFVGFKFARWSCCAPVRTFGSHWYDRYIIGRTE